ncbi:MAG: OB-fold domain-containing protein [Gammaproteobacteria bacterium]|nr:OB-fold domain-containing protein [Gammaproteobacteria bacterium]
MNEKPLPRVTALTRPFWDAIQREELHLQRCDECSAWVYYPSAWCRACYSARLTWTPCAGTGSVYSFSIVHYPQSEAFAADVPYVLAIIELTEGPHLMTNLVNCALDDVRIGLPVRMSVEARAGGFKVPQFEPAQRSGRQATPL